MDAEQLSIPGAWVFSPSVHDGPVGAFVEPYSAPEFAEMVGHRLSLGHVNVSVTRAGTLRGIHYGDVPPGQAKYITCVAGAVWDVVVDLRVGSPTFGAWQGVCLDDRRRRAVYLSEGLGHAYLSLAEGSVLVYICSQPYIEGREHRLDSLDPEIGIAWPTRGRHDEPLRYLRGRHDRAAPNLRDACNRGLLPGFEAVMGCVAGAPAQGRPHGPYVV